MTRSSPDLTTRPDRVHLVYKARGFLRTPLRSIRALMRTEATGATHHQGPAPLDRPATLGPFLAMRPCVGCQAIGATSCRFPSRHPALPSTVPLRYRSTRIDALAPLPLIVCRDDCSVA
jgi:hypothetical protein